MWTSAQSLWTMYSKVRILVHSLGIHAHRCESKDTRVGGKVARRNPDNLTGPKAPLMTWDWTMADFQKYPRLPQPW